MLFLTDMNKNYIHVVTYNVNPEIWNLFDNW